MTSLRQALADLLENDALTVEEATGRHFSPDFRHRANGRSVDRAAFVARMTELRGGTRQVRMTVLDELHAGDRYAERHIIDLTHADGSHTVQQVHVFATVDDAGRFAAIDEATFAV